MLDPLKFKMEDVDVNFDRYINICESDQWEAKKLVRIAQERQEDWFGLWVGEMARIAKPGAPVIIESIALPFCEETDEWGGVTQNWWIEVIQSNKYGWDIDPSSLDYGQDNVFDDRYHVFMRKKETSQ